MHLHVCEFEQTCLEHGKAQFDNIDGGTSRLPVTQCMTQRLTDNWI